MNNDKFVYAGNINTIELSPYTITFALCDGTEVLRFEPNGDIYVKEKLIENDKQVVDAIREFLKGYGVL